MSLISNESGVQFGMFLFLAVCAVAVLTYAVTEPLFTGANDAFDDEYRDEYLTTEGKATVSFLENMFYYGLFIFIMFAAAMMVINRSIYKGDQL